MYVSGSGISQRSAKPGRTLKCSSRVSRSSNRRVSMRSEKASIPTRGSRLVGLLSMIITSVSGAGLLEQERADNSSRHRRNVSIRCRISHIRDLAQNRRAACASSGWDVGRLPMPALKGEHRKGDGFLRLGGQTKFIGKAELNSRLSQFGIHHAQQGRILRATAGDDEFFVRSRHLHHKSSQRMGDGTCGQGGGSGYDVLLTRAPATTEEVADELAAKFFTSRGFRRLAQKERGTQQFRKNMFHDGARGGDRAIDVIRLVV